MLSRVNSRGLSGIEGYPIQVDVDISNGLPSYETVGLPDAAVRESKERVRAAIKNSGFNYPMTRITVNLAPADMRKEGSIYDLPIAIGLLAATGQLPPGAADDIIIIGELALNGETRPVSGVLPMLIDVLRSGGRKLMLPVDNAEEAAYIEGIELYPVKSLLEAAQFFTGELKIPPYPVRRYEQSNCKYSTDFSDISGQQGAKRAAEIAAAGGHNMLLVGSPGSGKTMLARSMPSILPELSFEEALEITKIHSVTGATKGLNGIITERPFRSPHHSASAVAMTGGGPKAMPGEVSLAHYGVLFLDEFTEFKREVLESLRQPLEDNFVTIIRANARSTYPADFMLVAAMNPCPCGNYGSRTVECRCTPMQIQRYRNRISGPMLDRIDLHVEMSAVGYAEITSKTKGEPSEAIRKRVNIARQIQRERYASEGILFNSQLNNKLIEKYCKPDTEGMKLLKQAFHKLKLSSRAYSRILKVSRTIADLEQTGEIKHHHIAEAVQYRSLDEKYWGD